VTSPGQPARSQPPGAADPAAVALPQHPLHALTTYELRDRRRELEHAINYVARDAHVQALLRAQLDAVQAEQDERARIARG
jgi:hypothetical protein